MAQINKLSLNIKQTNYIIFKSKQKLINYKLNIKIDNIEIEQVSFTKVSRYLHKRKSNMGKPC